MPSLPSEDGDRLLTTTTQSDHDLVNNSHLAASVGLPDGEFGVGSQAISEIENGLLNGTLMHSLAPEEVEDRGAMQLQLQDGTTYTGVSFGGDRSIVGELVFQTGMVGYPESITDPSYRGQILILTFPLAGNYGVPSRSARDEVVSQLAAHFESSQIQVSGLVVASYSGEDYSHHLATSSLGTWLKEQNVPAMYGVDTRALTKRIRVNGSMLGKLVREMKQNNGLIIGHDSETNGHGEPETEPIFERLDWFDPNTRNLAAEGKRALTTKHYFGNPNISH